MAQMEFLTFPVSVIRRSIRDIDSSYRNPWDIFAELAQNSVDAIRKANLPDNEKGVINIEVDAIAKTIVFEDNGCGISKDDLPNLLALFSSGKDGDADTVGEKGVGLKFVYFSSLFFEIVSSDGQTGSKAVIRDARLWKNATSNDMLMLDFEEVSNLSRGTKITLKDVALDSNDDEDLASIFNISFEQFKYVLRSKTYLGNTSSIWGQNEKPIVINIKFKDYNGLQFSESIDNSYALPTEVLQPADIVDLEVFEEWLKKADRSDADKRNKLQGKVLTLKGEYLHKSYRHISYFACFLPTRRDWDSINAAMKINIDSSDENAIAKYQYCLAGPGIYTAIKGMPTGITIENPTSGNSGYWPNVFMIFQDDALKFDIGRKSIHGKTAGIYQSKAKVLFNKITKYVTKYTSAVPVTPTSTSSFDRYTIRQDVDGLVNLSTSVVKFVKNPAEQEAAVSAIFFELIGNGTISDIEPIYLGYRQKHDLYANYKPAQGNSKFGFYEFKSHLRNLTRDFSEARKVFDEMDYVICWDVNDTDVQELMNFGITCDEIEQGVLHQLDCPSSVTHRLTIPNCNPVYVIDLKKLV